MKREIPALVLALLSSVSAQAGPKRLLHDWRLYVGETMMAGVLSADGHSTCRGMALGYVEQNRFARGSRSCDATIGRLAGAFVFYTGLNVLEQKLFRNDRNKIIRSTSPWMVPVAVTPFHAYNAARNYSLSAPR